MALQLSVTNAGHVTCVGYTHKRDLPQLALITYFGIGMTCAV